MLAHLLRRATAETFRGTLGGADLTALLDRFDRGRPVDAGELSPPPSCCAGSARCPAWPRSWSGLGMEGESPGHAAAALEFALEGLYLMRRLSKDDADGTATSRSERPHLRTI